MEQLDQAFNRATISFLENDGLYKIKILPSNTITDSMSATYNCNDIRKVGKLTKQGVDYEFEYSLKLGELPIQKGQAQLKLCLRSDDQTYNIIDIKHHQSESGYQAKLMTVEQDSPRVLKIWKGSKGILITFSKTIVDPNKDIQVEINNETIQPKIPEKNKLFFAHELKNEDKFVVRTHNSRIEFMCSTPDVKGVTYPELVEQKKRLSLPESKKSPPTRGDIKASAIVDFRNQGHYSLDKSSTTNPSHSNDNQGDLPIHTKNYYTNKIEELENKISKLNGVESKNSSLNDTIDGLRTEITKKNREIDILTKAKDTNDKDRNQWLVDKKQFEDKLSENENKISKLSGMIEEFEKMKDLKEIRQLFEEKMPDWSSLLQKVHLLAGVSAIPINNFSTESALSAANLELLEWLDRNSKADCLLENIKNSTTSLFPQDIKQIDDIISLNSRIIGLVADEIKAANELTDIQELHVTTANAIKEIFNSAQKGLESFYQVILKIYPEATTDLARYELAKYIVLINQLGIVGRSNEETL